MKIIPLKILALKKFRNFRTIVKLELPKRCQLKVALSNMTAQILKMKRVKILSGHKPKIFVYQQCRVHSLLELLIFSKPE